MSEIVAPAPARAKSRANVCPSTSPLSHDESASARFRSAAELLKEAWLSNDGEAEAACYGGDSDRLIRIAADYASDIADRVCQGDLQEEAFNVSALICAARLVPGDVEGPTRKRLLDRVAPLLRPLASPEGGFEEFGLPLASRPALSNSKGRGRSLNAAQLAMVMNVIAGRTATLHQLVMLSNDPCQTDMVREVCGDAAEALATFIGAMADDAVGGQILGGAHGWHYGSKFDDAGKEGVA